MLARGSPFPRGRGKVGMGVFGPVQNLMRCLHMEEGHCAPTPALPRYAGEGAQHHCHEQLDLRIFNCQREITIIVMSSLPDWQWLYAGEGQLLPPWAREGVQHHCHEQLARLAMTICC